MSDEIRRLSDELAREPASLVFLPLGEALRRQGQTDFALKVARVGGWVSFLEVHDPTHEFNYRYLLFLFELRKWKQLQIFTFDFRKSFSIVSKLV